MLWEPDFVKVQKFIRLRSSGPVGSVAGFYFWKYGNSLVCVVRARFRLNTKVAFVFYVLRVQSALGDGFVQTEICVFVYVF